MFSGARRSNQSAPYLSLTCCSIRQCRKNTHHEILERLSPNGWVGFRVQRRNSGNMWGRHACSRNRVEKILSMIGQAE